MYSYNHHLKYIASNLIENNYNTIECCGRMKETKLLKFKESITKTFLKTVNAFSNYDEGKKGKNIFYFLKLKETDKKIYVVE